MLSADADCWSRAVDQELSEMEKLHVWEIELIPGNKSLLGTVWVFRKKKDSEGIVVKFKACLCAQGSQQHDGYGFTYAPTGRSTSLRAALIVGLSRGHDIHQMDAKNAFLNGNLDENIYLQPPPGLDVPKGYCLKLKKAIYGLKQAPRVWYGELKNLCISINFSPSPADPCLFTSQVPDWECFVHVYADDMIIISHDVNRFKKLISKKFRMEDLGKAQHILGIKLTRLGDKQLLLNQETYTRSILENYNMSNHKPTNTPMLPNTRLVAASDADHQSFLQLKINYREALGLLNYLSVLTRPDISFTVSQLSQHLEKPGILHWKAVIHLLHYLSATPQNGIVLDSSGDISDAAVYTDADFANCTDVR
jgi:histone deacetylase 1/2